MHKTIPNKYVTEEDIKVFIQNNAQQNNGSVNIKAAFETMRKESPHIQVGYSKFEKLAKNIMAEQGFNLYIPNQNAQNVPMLPKKPSQQNLSRSSSKSELTGSNMNKTIMRFTSEFEHTVPRYNFCHVGGLITQKAQLADLILNPVIYKSLFMSTRCLPSPGILIIGPSGCGKSLLAEAAAGEFADSGLTFFKVSSLELLKLSKNYSDQSKDKLDALFASATNLSPSLILIDDIDAIAKGKENSFVRLYLTQCIDRVMNDKENFVAIIGTTSNIDKIDSSLRRPGRFGKEISIGLPDYDQRLEILRVAARQLNLDESVNFEQIAREADGFIGTDIVGLTEEASVTAVKRFISICQQENSQEGGNFNFNPENSFDVKITNDDFLNSIKLVQPTLRREGFITLAPASFADVGGLDEVKRELQMAVVDAIIRPDIFQMYGHKPSSGVILYGPPGCGKTLLARAIAHEANRAAFISVKGPELLNKFLGESESAIRSVFRRARDSAPCIIFFDELDAICPRRSDDSSNAAASRVVNQLLTEMDGVVDRGRVFVIGATNRLELIDEAMLRPGRLDKKIKVPIPDQNGRIEILSRQIGRINNKEEIDIPSIAERCQNFSGAMLEALTSEAIEAAISESNQEQWVPVGNKHFEAALAKLLKGEGNQMNE